MKIPFLNPVKKLTLAMLAISLFALHNASAGTEHWTGAGADSNWTTSANWTGITPPQTYFNDVDFYDFAGNTNLNVVSVDNIFNASTGVAQCPIYQLRMYPTNRNFTTLISSGAALYTGAGAGDLYVGGDTITSTRGQANLQETITFQGAGGLLAVTGTLHVGQGLTNTVQTTPPSTNYVTLNLSGLDTFVMAPSITGGTLFNGVPVGNTANGTAGSRFLLCGQIQRMSQGAIYLAKTNNILLGNDMEIGAMSVYSNSMPCPVYLGINNKILVGNNGAANGLVTVGSRGNTNAFIAFNPTFLGGATPPVATFSSPAAVNGGRVTTFYICLATGGVIPAYGYANFTGGNVSVMASTLQMGTAGTNGVGALGVLTFDNGVFNVNNAFVGDQTVSGPASSGAAGAGIINLNASSAYNTNATLQVNNVLTLGAVTGTPIAGTSGTLNINGGTLIANVVTNNGATAIVNMTNGAWQITATNTGLTNMSLSAFNAGGATNIIDVSFITPLLGSAYPVRFHLISAASITGASTLGVVLPASYEAGVPYVGYLDYTSNPGLVDLVLTSGPSSARSLTWTGSVADGFWDVGTTANWATNGVATTYNQLDVVAFNDIAATAQSNVDLTTTISPYSLTVSNNATLYTFNGGGSLSGITGLTKQGTGTLIIDNTTSNSFSGGVLISGGILQVGNNDTGGTLPIGPIVDNSVLAYGRTDDVKVGDAISGSGTVVSGGGGTVQLAAANTFTGSALATNNSVLQGGVTGAFGASSGSVIIANGSTLDPDGVATTKPVTVSGTGVNGEGAIINSGGPIYDTGGGLTPTLTLTGNTTFSYPNRWDLGGAGSTTSTLSTGGNAYNLTLNGGAYFEWRNVVVDSKLGNIYLESGTFGIVGTTSAGNPTNSLVVSNNTTLEFWPGNANASINKQVVLQDGGTIENAGTGGASTIAGPVVLTNVNGSQYCTFEIGGTSLTLASNVSGNGILDMEDDGGTLIVNGNASALTGGANIAYGVFDLNGAFGSGITNFAGTTLEGSGTCSGYVDVGEYGGSSFYPGGSNIVGTFTAAGLTLESATIVTMDLKSTTAIGGTNNDLVVVNGNLVANGNTIVINPVAGTLANGTYVLMTFTGTFSGSFGGAQTAAPSRYGLSLNVTANQVQLVVTGNPNTLVWNNGAGDALWNVQGSYDWTNLTKNIEDQFYTSDSVTFDDTISSSPHPATSITIPSGTVVYPSIVTNNSSANNYTIAGPGSISGGASIVKLGTSTLTLTATNTFNGNVTIAGGTLLTGANASLGSSTTGAVYVTNGGTLDLGYSLGAKPLVISGAGVNGAGALVNSIGAAIYDSPGGLANVTLAGNATIGGSNRVDFGVISPGSGTVASGGNNYNLTVLGAFYREWDNVAFDANFGNIYVMTTNGSVGVKGVTTLGNPTNLLSVSSNATVTLYADVSNSIVNKKIMLYGGSTLQNGTGTNLILSPVVLGIASGDNCTFNVGGTSLTVTNVISGSGNLVKTNSSPLILSGANTYTGNTVIMTGPLDLTNSGSISASPDITLAASQVLDVSGRTDKTLTLASGQTLQGSGTVNGNLVVSSGATVQPGASGSGSLTVTNIVTLQGTATLSVGATVTNTLIGASINYGGTLNLTIVGTLSAGNSFKLFNATNSTYAGSFASIVPATPGPGLQWNTSLLDTSGTLSVVAAATPTTFGTVSVSGTNLVLTGTGGTANGTYQVYSTTNAAALTNEAAAVASGILVGSGTFDGSGNFSFTNGINTNSPAQFFILKP